MISAKSIGRTLATARTAWELTRHQLALRAGVSAAAVRTAEQTGRVDASTLAAIVGAMGGTLDDLFTGSAFWEAPAIALKSASHHVDRASVMQGLVQVSTAARDYQALARFLELPDLWEERGARLGPVNVEGKELLQAEVLAKKIREVIGNPKEPIASVRAVMAHFGIATFFTQFASEAVDGATWRAADAPPCVVVNEKSRGGLVTAARMTFAHELCHALFDRPKRGSSGMVEVRGPRNAQLERRANAFAAYLLAPRQGVTRFLRDARLGAEEQPTQQHLLSLSRHFGMGVEAMAHHLVSCGIWTEDVMLRNRVMSTPPYDSTDARELRPSTAEMMVPLERRGSLLDLATMALAQQKITLGRWRELLKLDARMDWRLLLVERGVELDAEYYVSLRQEYHPDAQA